MTRRTALVIAGALLLTACGGGASSGTDSGKVVFWDTSGPNEHPVFDKVAKDCAAKGGYSVDVQQVSFDQALANYKTAAQGGQGPDVLRSDVGWVAQLAQNGLIADLSDAVTDTSDYLDGPLGSTRYNGKTYAVPQVTDTLALLYNKKKLADAGVQPPATWDELKADAPKLGGPNAIFLNNDAYYALPFIYGAGGDLLDVPNKKIVVNSAQNVQALQTAKGLLDAKAATTALDQANSYNNMKAAFSAGQVAMEIDGPWSVVDLLKGDAFKDPANLGVAVLPGVTAGKGSGPIGGQDYVVRQGTKAKASSVKLIQCMSATDAQVAISKQLGLLPTRKSAYDSPDVKSQPTVTAFEPAIKQAHPRPWVPAGAQLFDQLKIDYAYVLSGQKDAKSALDEVAKTYKDQVVTDYAAG
jgi:arabinogalactan oligomer/maltooligosaccharide transport system substrate-binding protein